MMGKKKPNAAVYTANFNGTSSNDTVTANNSGNIITYNRITMTSSGTLNFTGSGTKDIYVFLIGGGGSGGVGFTGSTSNTGYGGNGGNGGKVVSLKYTIDSDCSFNINAIGSGGAKPTSNGTSGIAGGITSVTLPNNTVITASGGTGGLYRTNGGSSASDQTPLDASGVPLPQTGGNGIKGDSSSSSKPGLYKDGRNGVNLTYETITFDPANNYAPGGGGGAGYTTADKPWNKAGGTGGATDGASGGNMSTDGSDCPATTYGGGGGGGGAINGTTSRKGGKGGSGVVMVFYT
jgi:hypothetical protein